MAKRGTQTSKKGKAQSAGKPKATRAKRGTAVPKRAAKHPKSKRSKSSSSSSSSSMKKKGHQKGKGKAPSGFNLYMKTAVSQVKQEHPGIKHKEAFKKAAEQWAVHPDNPKGADH